MGILGGGRSRRRQRDPADRRHGQLIGRQPFHALTFSGVRHDCGDKAGYIQANMRWRWNATTIRPVGPRIHQDALEELPPRTACRSSFD